ncbi:MULTISPECIES: hypothetical protein [unclassified Micromonospora]|uniref:hypothetical protein n=1 Tax=unclassified Micromonospora TaxID=2617518 RepID=UPI00098D23B7|nr:MULTISPECIES: hypothetical protein [unclassified Micromonospora]MDI5938332.1 hypothetical protein [Micromonospora sp. DH15]OON32641.1 hypothetical protein BSA16_04620 [Micromonospora sp. Rc5]
MSGDRPSPLVIERILRDRQGIWQQIVADRDLNGLTLRMLASSGVALACYGAVLGAFHSVLMALTSAVKLPLLFLVTLAICLPTLYLFNLVFGARLSVRQSLALVMVAITVTSMLAVAFAPISLFFLITAPDYGFFKLLNVAILTLSAVVGLRFLTGGMQVLNAHGLLAPAAAPSVAAPAVVPAAPALVPAAPALAVPAVQVTPQVVGQPAAEPVAVGANGASAATPAVPATPPVPAAPATPAVPAGPAAAAPANGAGEPAAPVPVAVGVPPQQMVAGQHLVPAGPGLLPPGFPAQQHRQWPYPAARPGPDAQRPASMTLLYVWILLFGFVGTQLAWTLRPFFGSPGEGFALFRSIEGNFYAEIIRTLGNLF